MRKEREQSLPEARKEGLVVQHLSDEVLVYDQQRHKAHCLNETAALIWMRCDGKTTVASMAQELSKQTGTRVGEEVVWLALDQLGRSRLLQGARVSCGRREPQRDDKEGRSCGSDSIAYGDEHRSANSRAGGHLQTERGGMHSSAQCCSGVCSATKCL